MHERGILDGAVAFGRFSRMRQFWPYCALALPIPALRRPAGTLHHASASFTLGIRTLPPQANYPTAIRDDTNCKTVSPTLRGSPPTRGSSKFGQKLRNPALL